MKKQSQISANFILSLLFTVKKNITRLIQKTSQKIYGRLSENAGFVKVRVTFKERDFKELSRSKLKELMNKISAN